MKNQELNIQLSISAGLTWPIREHWSHLTKKTTRRCLSDNIGALKIRIQRSPSRDLNMRYFIESISVEDEDEDIF